jgi:ATPase subunit of ABC transporter with duplicated ATPase domains
MSPPTIWTARAEWLYHQLESWQGGALIASHDRELLTRMPRIIELTPTALRSYGGNYDEYQRQRRRSSRPRARRWSMP